MTTITTKRSKNSMFVSMDQFREWYECKITNKFSNGKIRELVIEKKSRYKSEITGMQENY